MERTIARIRQLIGFGLTLQEIHDLVVSADLDEGTFYLCYCAAEILEAGAAES